MTGKAFDIRLIPKFHGIPSDFTVSEWLELVELVCEMCGVDNVERVLPLRLREGALSVYQRLTRDQKEDLQQVKQAILMAFVPDSSVAFDIFVSYRLCPGETVYKYLGDLQDLACLIKENTSDRRFRRTFVSGLPSPVRQQLRGSSRMEHMTQEQILARARALMTEEVEVDEPVATAARQCQVLPRVPVGPPSTPTNRMQVQCGATSVEVPITLPETASSPEVNHKECSQRYVVISARNKDMSHQGVRKTRQEASTTLSPHKLEEVLPVMKVKVNGMDQIVLVDSGWSSSVVSGMLCRSKVWKSTAILTAGRECLLSYGVGSITLTVTNRNSLKTNVLVVNSKPLGFNLLLGMDVIKKLGSLHIDEGGKVHFAEAAHTSGAAIELEQPDFCAEINQRSKLWTVS